MRRYASVILIAFAFLLIFAVVVSRFSGEGSPGPNETFDPDKIIIVPETDDIEITMYNHKTGKLEKMPLEEYLIGVLAGEMPASYEMEALKAQAVAARTLIISKLKRFGGKGCSKNPGADVCSSYAHCQEWIPLESMQKNWGGSFDKYYGRLKQAVNETVGLIMKYEGKPIEVFYHSTSNGKTEDAGEVFSRSLPYYKVVSSPEGEDLTGTGVTFSNKEFVDIFSRHYKNSLNPNNLANQVKINGYTKSGRVKSITVGGITLRATDFRMMYGLNSTDFTLQFGKSSVTIYTKGFGHGVGMSQVGADRMAKAGSTFRDILLHYYQGVAIEHY